MFALWLSGDNKIRREMLTAFEKTRCKNGGGSCRKQSRQGLFYRNSADEIVFIRETQLVFDQCR